MCKMIWGSGVSRRVCVRVCVFWRGRTDAEVRSKIRRENHCPVCASTMLYKGPASSNSGIQHRRLLRVPEESDLLFSRNFVCSVRA